MLEFGHTYVEGGLIEHEKCEFGGALKSYLTKRVMGYPFALKSASYIPLYLVESAWFTSQ